jgi:hypothetical protein
MADYSTRKELSAVKVQSPPKYDQESKERARYARNLADLLLRKASSQVTPEAWELVNQCMSIQEMVTAVVPEDAEKIEYTFERIAETAEKAEDLLVDCPKATALPSGLQWEDFQAAAKEEQADASHV